MIRVISRLFSCHSTHSTNQDNPGPKTITSTYSFGPMLGSPGSYGKVYLGIRHKTREKFAIKLIEHRDSQELEIMETISHENIIKFIESYKTKKSIYIVMERCDGDLFDIIMKNGGRISEKDAVKFVHQILQAIRYLHSLDIVHCDLKLSNILYTKQCLKIIDFGCSQKNADGELLHEHVGSVNFMAPEVISGSYNKACDLWSIGCIVYIMLFGYNPFNPTSSKSSSVVYQNILKGFQNETRKGFGAFFPEQISISPDAKDFISNLLMLDYHVRMTVDEALHHPWITNYFKP